MMATQIMWRSGFAPPQAGDDGNRSGGEHRNTGWQQRHQGDRNQRTADRDQPTRGIVEARPDQRQECRRNDRVEAERRRVPDRGTAEGTGNRAEVPHDEQQDTGEPERVALLSLVIAGYHHGRGFVEHELGGDSHPPTTDSQYLNEANPVERVADAE